MSSCKNNKISSPSGKATRDELTPSINAQQKTKSTTRSRRAYPQGR